MTIPQPIAYFSAVADFTKIRRPPCSNAVSPGSKNLNQPSVLSSATTLPRRAQPPPPIARARGKVLVLRTHILIAGRAIVTKPRPARPTEFESTAEFLRRGGRIKRITTADAAAWHELRDRLGYSSSGSAPGQRRSAELRRVLRRLDCCAPVRVAG